MILIEKQKALDHLRERLHEAAAEFATIVCGADAVFEEIAENRIQIWLDEVQPEQPKQHDISKATFTCPICGAEMEVTAEWGGATQNDTDQGHRPAGYGSAEDNQRDVWARVGYTPEGYV